MIQGVHACMISTSKVTNPSYVKFVLKFCPSMIFATFNPLNAELNPICHLQALLGTHLIFHVSRIKLTLRLLMSYIYIYMEHPFLMFLDYTQRRTTVGKTPLDE